jgi:hypothetical protein
MARRHTITLAVVVAAAVPLIAGCGGSPSHAAAQKAKGPAAQAFAYARCIRAHGVRDFPDPQVVTAPGSTGIRQAVPAGAGLSPKFSAAQKACRNILPAPGSGGSDQAGPGKQTLLAFARCLRAHGVSDFPDPNARGQLTLQMIGAAGVDVHAPGFLKAGRACVSVTHGAITMAQVAAAATGGH